MRATITNFRGLASASLDVTKICLLAGPNEAGKTSTSQALAAALTGDPVPINGVKKTQAGLLVRSGSANGSIKLATDAGTTEIQWPAAKVKTEGKAPFASHFAAGLHSIVNLEDKERVRVLTEYLQAVPLRADLDSQLASMNLPTTVLDQLWKLIETQGWDNAYTQIRDKGARLKGQWENVTGDRYGSKKAETWIPEGYDNELMGQSETTLQAVVTDARDALESAIADEAVDENKIAELRAVADLVEQRGKALDAANAMKPSAELAKQVIDANNLIAPFRSQRDAIKITLEELPRPENPFNLPCPSCQTPLELTPGKKLSIAKILTDAEQAERRAAIAAETEKLQSIDAEIASHNAAVEKIKAQIKAEEDDINEQGRETKRLYFESKAAAEKISKMKPARSNTTGVEQFRSTLALAEKRLKAFTQKNEADRLHTSISQNAELMAKIAPEGIRGDVLTRALKGFNESIEKFSRAAGWRAVTLEADFMPTYGGTLYLLLSESAKFRVRVILQIGMALMDKSQALIIDAADILDKGGRNGLFKAVKSAGLPALIAMTIDSKEQVPNLAKAGIGRSYWLNSEATAEELE